MYHCYHYYNYFLFLGVCPQQNVIFDFLTVKEHLEFYSGLKGVANGSLNSKVTGCCFSFAHQNSKLCFLVQHCLVVRACDFAIVAQGSNPALTTLVPN